MQSRCILRKAIERHIPACVSLDSRVKLVHIVSWISCAPLYCQNVYLLHLCVLFLRFFPRLHLNRLETLIVRIYLGFGVLDDLAPGVLDGLVFLAQLTHNVSKIDHGFGLLGFELKRLFTQFETFFELVHLNVHDGQVRVSIYKCVKRVQLA